MKRFEEEEDVSFKRPRSACFIILAVATFVFLVISIVFITLYALEKSKSPQTPTAGPRIPEQKYCGTRACFETSKGKPTDVSLCICLKIAQKAFAHNPTKRW